MVLIHIHCLGKNQNELQAIRSCTQLAVAVTAKSLVPARIFTIFQYETPALKSNSA
jgi:hypothetical protein